MWKHTLVAFFVLTLAGASGERYRVSLPLGGNRDTPVFYIDLENLRVENSSLELATPAGERLPFSLDRQYGPLPEPGVIHYTRVNGYHSHIESPLAEGGLSRLGYLSFKAVEGVDEYILSFLPGAEPIGPSPNPDARAWWVELMRDPYLKSELGDPKSLYRRSNKDIATLEGGGWRFADSGGSVSIKRDAYAFTDLIRGRRVTQYFIARMDSDTSIVPRVPLANAVTPKWAALSGYTRFKKDVMTECWQEGLQDGLADSIWYGEGRKGEGSFWIASKTGGEILEVHIQSPPQDTPVQAMVVNTLHYIGDTIKSEVRNLGRTVMQPMSFALTAPDGSLSRIAGAREDNWGAEAELWMSLVDADGREVAHAHGTELETEGLPAGNYTVQLELYSDSKKENLITRNDAPVTLISGPQW